MQLSYRISKAAPILSYLSRFIKIVRADFERSANMQKKTTTNNQLPSIVPPITQDLGKPHLVSRSLVPYPEFHLNLACAFVSSNRHRVLYTRHFSKNVFSDSLELKSWRFIKISTSIFLKLLFYDDNTFAIGKVELFYRSLFRFGEYYSRKICKVDI